MCGVEDDGRHAELAQLLGGAVERVVALVLFDLLAVAVRPAGVGHGVAAVAVGHRLDDGRAAVLAGRVEQLGDRVADLDQVVAVDALAVHPVGARAFVQLRLGRRALDARAHAVDVVDDQEHDRKRQQQQE